MDAFLRIADREGLDAVTSRAIAAELGIASGALWHYFENFDAVFTAAFTAIYDRTSERIERSTGDLDGLAALRAMIAEILPVSAEAQSEAGIVVAFWGRAAANHFLARYQAEAEEAWRTRMIGYLTAGVRGGELTPRSPITSIADVISSVCLGQQVEYVMRSPLGKPERQLALIDAVLSPWLGDRGSGIAGGAGNGKAPHTAGPSRTVSTQCGA